MTDNFTRKWKEKIGEHYTNTGKFEHLAFANGFSIMHFFLLIFFCLPWAFVYTMNKQYVVGFDRDTRTLFLFHRGIFGGISGAIEEISLAAATHLDIGDNSIKFTDANGKNRVLNTVWITRANFTAIARAIRVS